MTSMPCRPLALSFTALSFTALSLCAVACGSSSQRSQPSAADPVSPQDSGVADTSPTVAVRTLKSGNLLGGSPRNLLLDPNFGGANQPSWGHFMLGLAAAKMEVRILSASPGGVASPVALVRDPAATDDKSRAISLISSFTGGPGPYRAKVWVSASNVAGEPVDLPNDPTAAGASITAAARESGKSVAYDLTRDESASMVIGARRWVLFAAKIDGALPAGGFFNIKLGRLGGQFQLTAPEVVPIALEPAPKSLQPSARFAIARAASDEEKALAEAYSRLPVRLESARSASRDPALPPTP